MATFEVIEFPALPGGQWGDGIQVGSLSIGLAFALAATAMKPAPAQIDYELIRLEVDLVARLVDDPGHAPLRRRAATDNASLHLKRLASEAVGRAVTARMASERHGWNPAAGWPQDLDLIPGMQGVRPDLLFPLPGGPQVAAEARGRSRGRRTLTPSSDQRSRAVALEQWRSAHGVGKAYMAWAWITTQGTRVDYFDPGEPNAVVDLETLVTRMRAQAMRLRGSAEVAGLDETEVSGIRALGEWFAPIGINLEIFLGVQDPETIDFRERINTHVYERDATEAEVFDGQVAVLGPIVTAVRERASAGPRTNLA